MRRLLSGPRENPWRRFLLEVATILSCSSQIVLALGHDSREILPKPNIIPTQALLQVNETLNLTCLTQENSTSTRWLKDGRYLPSNDRRHLSDGNQTLALTGVTRADAGTYRCEVRNASLFGRSEAAVVSVAYGPDTVKISPSGNITQLFGSPLNLTCSADSVPASQFNWFFNNTSVGQNGSVMALNLTVWEHRGTYECRAFNPLTNLTGRASVSVEIVMKQEPTPVPLKSSPRLISGIVVALLAAAVLIATTLYCFYACVQNSKSPQSPSTASLSGNQPSGIQDRPAPKPENPSDPSSTYQALQYKDEAVYQELGR